MNDITVSGNQRTILDNELLITSTTTPGLRVLAVDPNTNTVVINKNTAATATLDITGSTAISSTLNVQTNKLVVDSSGHVGINTIPSGSYQLEIGGSVLISGSLWAFGTITSLLTATFETTDSNILLNNGGTDASALGAGFTIQRTSNDAQLIWDNTRQNFRAGLISDTTSLIRVGGNSDGATLTIGTKDNFGFNLETNNTSRVSISNTGDVAFTGNVDITGSFTIEGIPVEYSGAPLGGITAFIPGVFSNSSNGGFSVILGTLNTAASVNTWLAANGYDHWKVCDGTAYNVAGSALYGGVSRFTPNLTDDRFLMGSTTSASLGGTSDRTHTHSVPTALGSISIAHSHTVASGTIPHSNQSFGVDAAAGFNTGGPSAGSVSTYTPNTENFSHSHSLSHSHSGSGYYATGMIELCQFVYDVYTGGDGWTSNISAPTNGDAPASGSRSIGAPVGGTSSGMSPSSSSSTLLGSYGYNHNHPSGSHAHTVCHAHGATGNHNHGPGCHGHNDAGTSWTVSSPATAYNTQFSHTHTTNSTSNTENRPQYLTCFYLVRVI